MQKPHGSAGSAGSTGQVRRSKSPWTCTRTDSSFEARPLALWGFPILQDLWRIRGKITRSAENMVVYYQKTGIVAETGDLTGPFLGETD